MTATTITIAGHTTASGPGASGYAEIAPAAGAYFHWVNDHGGVYGRSIIYKVVDDAGNADTAVTLMSQVLAQGDLFAVFAGGATTTHQAVAPLLDRDRVPDLFVASGCACWNAPRSSPFTFGFEPDQLVEGQIEGHYVAGHFGADRIGYLAVDDVSGRDGVRGLDREIPPAAVVSRQMVAATPGTDLGPHLVALQAAGATVVVCYADPASTALALAGAAKIGFHPTWVVSGRGSDPVTLRRLLGADGPAIPSGMVTDSYLANVTDAANPWTKVFKQIHDRYIPALPLDGAVEHGMALAYTLVQAMVAAGPNPTREGVVKAIEGARFDGPGVVPLRYAASDHAGFPGTQMATVENGVLDLTGLPMVVTPGGSVESYAGPANLPPVDGIPTGR